MKTSVRNSKAPPFQAINNRVRSGHSPGENTKMATPAIVPSQILV